MDLEYEEINLIEILLDDLQDFQSGWRGVDKFVRSDLTESLQERLWQLEYGNTIFQNLKRLNANVTDVTIKVDGKVFHGHRNVLAAASRYFEVMFTTDFKERTAKEVELKDIDGDVFQVIFDFIYSGKMELTADNAISALQLAGFLGLRNAEHPFHEYFSKTLPKKELTPEELLYLREAAVANGMYNLGDNLVFGYLLREFEQLMKSELFAEKVPSDLIRLYFLHSDSFDISEEQLLCCITKWLKYDWENRKGEAHKYLRKIRFGMIPKEKVKELMDAQILEIPECKMMMDDLIEQQREFEDVDDPMKLPESLLPRRLIKTLVAFGGKREVPVQKCDADDSYEEFGHYFDKESETWVPLTVRPKMPGIAFELKFPSVVVVNRDIYLAGGYEDYYSSESIDFFKLDGNSYKWTELPPMRFGRANFALVHHDGLLYAIGGEVTTSAVLPAESGYLDRVDRFNMSLQRWERVDPLPERLVNTSAVVIDGKILVYGLNRCVDDEAEFWLVGFDPVTERWSNLLQDRYHHKVDEAPDSVLVLHDGDCYRVWYEEEVPRNDSDPVIYKPHVNHIQIETIGGTLTASVGREIMHQGFGTDLPVNNGNAFHIDDHVYLSACRFVHKTGVRLNRRELDVTESDLNGWACCWSLYPKHVVEYTFDCKKMR